MASCTLRVVIPLVGTAEKAGALDLCPPTGRVTNVQVTVDPAVDPAASLGTTGATDLYVAITEGAAPPSQFQRILVYAFAVAPVPASLYVDSAEWRPYHAALYVRVAVNQQLGGVANAIAVALITIETDD